jgi:hypothetical protein
MSSLGVALIVALGCAIGAAIATPHEYQDAVFMFIFWNSFFWGLFYHFGRYAVRTYRDLYSDHR